MLNATRVGGGFAFADNIFYQENTLTSFKTQVERFSQQSIESLGVGFSITSSEEFFKKRVLETTKVLSSRKMGE